MGPNTMSVPMELFQENRSRLVSPVQEKNKDSVILLQGGSEISFYDSDTTYLFQQVNILNDLLIDESLSDLCNSKQ